MPRMRTATTLGLGLALLSAPRAAADVTLASVAAPPAFADDSPATLTCVATVTPGRVLCHAEARVAPNETISWGDVVLTSIPPFAVALRGRIGPHDATRASPTDWRWDFALAAREKGSGVVEGRVRLVVCHDEVCVPREIPVTGVLVVGPAPPDGGS